MNPAFVTGISRDQELTADRIRGFAVEAFSGLLAGCLDVKSLGIGRSRHISGPLHSIIEVRTDFIHSHDKDHFSRSLGDTGHAIGISVDIPTAIFLSVLSAVAACGASGVAGGSLLLIPMACSLFGISNDIAMRVVGVGFIIGVVQDSLETAINSSGDVLFAATAEYREWIKEGRKLPF